MTVAFSTNPIPSINPASKTKNVVIFGESGAGKSSVVNMLLGEERAKASESARGCTFASAEYTLALTDKSPVVLWDTVGLNEGDAGRVSNAKAIIQLYRLLHRLSDTGGVSLLVFVVRGGRVNQNTQQNWTLFVDVICRLQVPTLLVLTNMENEAEREEGMDGWFEDNKKTYEAYRIVPRAYACVTATKGRELEDGEWTNDDIYEDSRDRLLERLQRCAFDSEPFNDSPRSWFKTVWEIIRDKIPGTESGTKSRAEFRDDILKELKGKCGLTQEEVDGLAAEFNDTAHN
jgi:predicted GTPase